MKWLHWVEHETVARQSSVILGGMDDREVLFCVGYQEILGMEKQDSSSAAPSTIMTMLELWLGHMPTPKKPHALSFVVKL